MGGAMRLLLVEDDPILGNGIEAGLKQAGFTVDWAQDGRSAQLALETTTYELVVLDLGLPRVSGMELLRQLRARGSDLPVLVLTARDTVRDRVAGLEAGADDYLVKPFDLAELVARIRALLRRAHGRSIDTIRYRDLLVVPGSLTVTRGEETIALSGRECASLVDLLEHQGVALSRARLEENLYGWNEKAREEIHELADARLQQGARTLMMLDLKRLARLAQTGEAGAKDEADGHHVEAIGAQPLAFQIWGDDGQLLLASAGAPAAPQDLHDGYATRNIDGRSWRSYSLRDARHDYRVTVLEPLALREHPANQLAGRMGQVLLLALPVLALDRKSTRLNSSH